MGRGGGGVGLGGFMGSPKGLGLRVSDLGCKVEGLAFLSLVKHLKI